MGVNKKLIATFFFSTVLFAGPAQKVVTFLAPDGLLLTADAYIEDEKNPYMILFHQEGSSRGEYRETAPRLMKFGYNCLAVDLRSGKEANYVQNESARLALKTGKKNDYLSCLQDIKAAIDYVRLSDTSRQVILVGSSFSASLCLMAAIHHPGVKAVIAFSPGEYFAPRLILRDALAGFDKPALITGTTEEASYWKELFSKTDLSRLTFFVPEKKKGVHGSRALSSVSEAQTDYWIEVMLFLKKAGAGG